MYTSYCVCSCVLALSEDPAEESGIGGAAFRRALSILAGDLCRVFVHRYRRDCGAHWRLCKRVSDGRDGCRRRRRRSYVISAGMRVCLSSLPAAE